MRVWKTVKGFEDYEISNDGQIKSHKHGRSVILKPRITHDGYVWYNLCVNGRQHTKRANRLVAEAFILNTEGKSTVNHKDGDKLNNAADNLEWATREEQMRHAYAHGLKKPVRGCLQGNHMLSEAEVKEIRAAYKSHNKECGMLALAKIYSVSPATIDKCVRRVTYTDVE